MTISEALKIYGFSSLEEISVDKVKSVYKDLSKIYHPDAETGDVLKQQKINEGKKLLLKYAFDKNFDENKASGESSDSSGAGASEKKEKKSSFYEKKENPFSESVSDREESCMYSKRRNAKTFVFKNKKKETCFEKYEYVKHKFVNSKHEELFENQLGVNSDDFFIEKKGSFLHTGMLFGNVPASKVFKDYKNREFYYLKKERDLIIKRNQLLAREYEKAFLSQANIKNPKYVEIVKNAFNGYVNDCPELHGGIFVSVSDKSGTVIEDVFKEDVEKNNAERSLKGNVFRTASFIKNIFFNAFRSALAAVLLTNRWLTFFYVFFGFFYHLAYGENRNILESMSLFKGLFHWIPFVAEYKYSILIYFGIAIISKKYVFSRKRESGGFFKNIFLFKEVLFSFKDVFKDFNSISFKPKKSEYCNPSWKFLSKKNSM